MLSKLKKPITLFILTAVAIISLLPLYWVFSTALQLPSYQNEEMDRPVSYVESSPPKLYPAGIPEYFSQWSKKREAERNDDPEQAQIHAELMTEVREKTFGAFTKLFTTTPVMNWLFNSMYIAIVTTLLIVLIDTMAGYVFAKKQFPGKWIFFWVIIATMMIPEQVTLVPTFIIIRDLGLIDNHLALILPSLAAAFGVFLMRQFLLSVPDELIEAAKIDGASELRIFFKIVIPLAIPAMVTLGIFTFVLVWNSFLWPIIVINDVNLMTLPAGLKTLQDANLADFKFLMAGATVAALPIIVIFLMFQRFFLKGLTMGGVKE